MSRLTDGRFKDAPWYEGCLSENIMIVGMGGIGSNLLYYASKTVPAKYHIIDMDIVEEYNVGCQFFSKKDIGKMKVNAIWTSINEFSDTTIVPYVKKYDRDYLPIMISALDNMKTREEMFNVWKCRDDREIFIDGRLRANYYEVFAVTKGREEEYEKTLFNDTDVDEGHCTFKQTAYFGGLIGARITHVLVNYLTNKYSKEDVCNLPFKITEFGEPFYIEIL